MARLLPTPVFGSIRYRHGATMHSVLATAVILAVLAFIPNSEGDLKPWVLPFAAVGLAFYLYPLVRRTKVVATSAEGVELQTFVGARRTFVAWRDVEAVVLWRQPGGMAKQTFVGVERTQDAPPLPREAKQGLVTVKTDPAALPPGISARLASASVPAGRIDPGALATLIAAASAEVPVVDAQDPMSPKQVRPT
ncbi:hypothetical protein AB0B28_18950 [Glycomyces sp. NPDC046736]|uniref:hypothetical protein n=1 Tax=Glycomyces sp. NPDC046736 TaxID=3155615 RepID=UPI0033F36120